MQSSVAYHPPELPPAIAARLAANRAAKEAAAAAAAAAGTPATPAATPAPANATTIISVNTNPHAQTSATTPAAWNNAAAPRVAQTTAQAAPTQQPSNPWQRQMQQPQPAQPLMPMQQTMPASAPVSTVPPNPYSHLVSRSAPSFLAGRSSASAGAAAQQQPWRAAPTAVANQTISQQQQPVASQRQMQQQQQPMIPQRQMQQQVQQQQPSQFMSAHPAASSSVMWRPTMAPPPPSAAAASSTPRMPLAATPPRTGAAPVQWTSTTGPQRPFMPSLPAASTPPRAPFGGINGRIGDATMATAPASAPAPTTAPPTPGQNIWAGIRPQPPQKANPIPTPPPAAAASSTAGQTPASSHPQAAFLSRFQQPPPAASTTPNRLNGMGPGPAASALGRPAAACSGPPPQSPLCRGHSQPMHTGISHKPPNDGQRYWHCYMFYASPKEACKSFVWERDLAASGLRMQQRGPNGEFISEVQLSFDIVSVDSFSITITPPNAEVIAVMREHHGVPDESNANLSNFHRENPATWIFSLQHHDDILHALEAQSKQNGHLWKVVGIPPSARTLLMNDLQIARMQSYARQAQESDAAHAISSQLAPSPVISPSGADSPPPRARSHNDTGSDDDFEDDAPIVAPSRKPKSRLLMTKAEKEVAAASAKAKAKKAADVESARHLTLEEQTKLNPDKLPPHLRVVLLPFQMEGVEYLVSRGGRGLLADEMGLGKSLQALSVASYYHEDWPLLIICPSSLRLNWGEEITKWLPFMSRENIFVVLNAKDGHAVLTKDRENKKVQGHTFGIVIVSYDLVPKLIDEIKAYKFGVIIGDESHNLKNSKAQRTKAILPLLKATKRAILLSGTPAMNRPAELYTQISAIKPKLYPRFEEFGMRYCNGHKSAYGWDFTGASHLRELHVLLKKYMLIRREKSEVLKQLPSKRRQTITLDVPASRLSKLKKMKAEHDALVGDDLLRGGGQDPHLTRMFMLTGEAKVDSVCEYIDELIGAGIKFLLFGHHQHVLDQLEHFVRVHKLLPNYVRIDGSTPAVKRQEYVKLFQEDASCKVAILSITAAGTGLTLTSASHVVMAELHWTPATLVQAEDRVHRIGQNESVNIHYLLARGTLDDIMWPLISRKLAVIGQAVSGADMHMEIDESKQYSSIDREQKRLTGFYPSGLEEDASHDYNEAADATTAAAATSTDAAALSRMDDDDDLFLKGDYPPIAPTAGPRYTHDGLPAKRQKTQTPHEHESTTSHGDHFIDDSEEEIDMTLTPVAPTSTGSIFTPPPARSPVVGRSPNAPVSAPFARRKPTMMTANSPAVKAAGTSPSTRMAETHISPVVSAAASTTTMPNAADDHASPNPSQHSPGSNKSPASSVRRRKRIRMASEDEEDVSDSHSPWTVVDGAAAADSSSSSPPRTKRDRLFEEDEEGHDESDFEFEEATATEEHVRTTTATKLTPPAAAAVAPPPSSASRQPAARAPPLPVSAKKSSDSTPTPTPSAPAASSVMFPDLEDEDDFLDD